MMTHKEINDICGRLDILVRARRLRDAFELLRNTARGAAAHDLDDRAAQLEQTYAYMLRYLTDGLDDPERDRVYADIVAGIYTIADSLRRRITAIEAPTLYYNKLRYRRMNPVSLSSVLATGNEKELFEAIWTTYPLSSGDADAILAAFNEAPMSRRQIIVSALTLALLEFYDEQALLLLVDIYSLTANDDSRIPANTRALSGILLALFRHRKRDISRQVANRLALLNDEPRWREDVRMAFIEFIRTRDTERITRTMTDEIIPGMQKIDPEMVRRLSEDINGADAFDISENPEWEKMLNDSGITDRLKQLGELQQQGGDVFMATFSHLKMFPFFSDPSAWFIPFDSHAKTVIDSGVDKKLAALIEAMPMLCDNDKYSLIFALGQVPETQRSFMLSQISAQNEQMLDEIKHATAVDLPVEQRRRALRNYLQNLNRFFKLFRRKNEFADPFADNINLLKVKSLSSSIDAETTRAAAEFFLNAQLYDDALDAFRQVDAQGDPDPVVFEKIGWCYYKLGKPSEAIDYYQQAELFTPDNTWLLKQLAAACRAAGDTVQAVDYMRRLAEASPESTPLTLQLGYAYLQNKQLDEALNTFYKIEFTAENPASAWRPIAWTLFLKGDFARADSYYQRIIGDNPTPEDYLNMGHNALGANRVKEAINFYKLSMQAAGKSIDSLLKDIVADRDAITAAGVAPATLALVTDALRYSIRN